MRHNLTISLKSLWYQLSNDTWHGSWLPALWRLKNQRTWRVGLARWFVGCIQLSFSKITVVVIQLYFRIVICSTYSSTYRCIWVIGRCIYDEVHKWCASSNKGVPAQRRRVCLSCEGNERHEMQPYTMRIYAIKDETSVRRECDGVKAPGRYPNEAQAWLFITKLTADSWPSTFAEAAELTERWKFKLADTGECKPAGETKDRSERCPS